MIMQKNYPNYEIHNEYARLASYIFAMIEGNDEFIEKIKKSQFTGNNEWQLFLGKKSSEKLIKLCANHYDLVVNRLFDLINDENLQKHDVFCNTDVL